MNYRNLSTGEFAVIPWSAQQSLELGVGKWMDESGCTTCGVKPVGRYVADGACVKCAQAAASQEWSLWCMGSPARPEKFARSREQAVALGVDHYFEEQLCSHGNHFRAPNVKTGKCEHCKMLKKPAMPDDMVIGRTEAAALGMTTYRTGEPCRRGHTGWRYISNGGCVQCMRGDISVPELIDMNKLVTVDEQAYLFIGYAWDGSKFVTPQGKRVARYQFDARIGAARYQVRDGRPDVFKASEAFISNFCV